MIVRPRLAHDIEGLELVDPAEELVQLCGHQELPDPGPGQGGRQLVALLGQVQHLVTGRGHTPARGQAGGRAGNNIDVKVLSELNLYRSAGFIFIH